LAVKPAPSTILILGGYGTFGGRLARLLADEVGLALLIAGRSRDKAAAFCATLASGATKVPISFDRDGDVESQLRTIKPDVLVDATGPFQAYGENPYRVVKACLELGIDYIDLADAADFVQGIAQFDTSAREREVFALSGASTCPALTAAVVRHLSRHLCHIDSVSGGIAPSPYAGIGANVFRAVASYAGRPIPLLRNGRAALGYPLTEARRFTIAPPGSLPLPSLRFSLVEVPELRVFRDLWPQLETIWFGAATRPEILQRLLTGLAWLVRLKLVTSLLPLAGLFDLGASKVRWGEHRGGMYVCVHGRAADGTRRHLSWHIVAEGDDGPFIPAMAAAAIIRRTRLGTAPAPGARPASRELEIQDFDPLFSARAITYGCRSAEDSGSLYQRVLGEAWSRLPEAVRDLHGALRQSRFVGEARVERGRGILSRIVATCIGFPSVGDAVPVVVRFDEEGGREIWHRTFAGRSFRSSQAQGTGRWEGLIVERFGPVAAGLALVVERSKLRLIVKRWSLFGIPLPAILAPGGETYEAAPHGRFHFHVEIRHPLTGLIVRYIGWLKPEERMPPAPHLARTPGELA
jgi:hypothetical protein